MTGYLGDFAADSNIYLQWSSFANTGASVTATGFANTDVLVFKNGSAVSKVSSNSLYITTDFSGNTGLHHIRIDTSDNSGDIGFYAAGADYQVAVADITIDAQTVRTWMGQFSIENRYAAPATVSGVISANVQFVAGQSVSGPSDLMANTTTLATAASITALNNIGISNVATTVAGELTSYDALVPGDLPTNFGVLSINAQGRAAANVVSVGTNAVTAPSDFMADVSGVATPAQVLTEANNALQTYDAVVPADLPTNFATLAINGTGVVQANTVAISGDSVAADNLELMFDGTGYIDGNAPSTQDQLLSITNVGSAVNKAPASYTLTTGTLSSGLVSNVAPLDNVYHTHTSAAGVMDLYYEFTLGAGATPSSVTFTGYLLASNDSLEVYGYDWITSGWVRIGTLAGKNQTANEVNNYNLFVGMVGTGADSGKVRVRFTDGAFTLTTATLAIDQLFVSFSQSVEGYTDAAVWLDTNATNTNTVVGIDGTAPNPVSTIGAASTLLASTNLRRIQCISGSSITLGEAHTSELILGHGYTVALGGQDLDESHIFDAAVSGVATSATEIEFHDCEISTASLQLAHLYNCTFNGTVTFTLAGDYHIINSQSGVPGASSPIFTKTAGQAITVEFRRWSGGVTFSGIESGDTMTISGELGTVTLNGADGTVEIRGTYKAIVDNRTGSPTLNIAGAISASDVAAILANQPTNFSVLNINGTGQVVANVATLASVDTSLVDKIWDESTSTHQGSGTMGQAIRPLFAGGATTGNTTTVTLSGAAPTTGHYVGSTVEIITNTGYGQSRLVTAYDGAGRVATVTPDWTTAPDATSRVIVRGGSQADLRTINGEILPVTNFEDQYDGTGYTDSTGPATQASISGLNDVATSDILVQANNALQTYDAPTKAELDSGLALIATPAQVLTEANNALQTYDALVPADLPTNFGSMSISGTGITQANTSFISGVSVSGPDDLKANTALLATTAVINALNDVGISNVATTIAAALTTYDALVAADLPTNFGSMSINGQGRVAANVVSVGTNAVTSPDDFKSTGGVVTANVAFIAGISVSGPDDLKANTSLLATAASLPTNFDTLAINGQGRVAANVVSVGTNAVTTPDDFKAATNVNVSATVDANTAMLIANNVWSANTADFASAGSFGEFLSSKALTVVKFLSFK